MALLKKTPQNGFKPLKKALKPITGKQFFSDISNGNQNN